MKKVGPAILFAAALLAGCATSTTISEQDYRILQRVMDRIEQRQYAEAEDALGPLLAGPPGYTAAVAHQTMAYIHAMQGREAEAAAQYELALEGDFLPPDVRAQIRQNRAVFLARAGHCAEAMPLLDEWSGDGAPRNVRIAQLCCYAEAKRFDEAALLHRSVLHELGSPRPAFLELGRDIDSARTGKAFPPGHFSGFFERQPAATDPPANPG